MPALRRRIHTFLRDEAGAVTVEYVVLAAAITGMAIATSDILDRGLDAVGSTVDTELRGDPVGGPAGMGYDDGFDHGAAGWSGAAAANVRGFGNVLGPIAGSGGAQSVSKEFDIEPGAKAATFKFDLIAGDSLDGESGIVFIDGREVGRMTTNYHDGTTFTPAADLAARGITFEAKMLHDRNDMGGETSRSDWVDSRASISITVANPAERVRFGFGSNADQGVGDEFFAIDNFQASGLKDPGRSQ